jgi:peptide/nickel transport system permease protein
MVEAARALGVGTPRILVRYILPALVAPLTVQATYIGASAILFEAALSFLGAGTPPHIPSWGNMMAEGKTFVQLAFWIILFPGLFLALTVLAINLVGDGLRDLLNVRG